MILDNKYRAQIKSDLLYIIEGIEVAKYTFLLKRVK